MRREVATYLGGVPGGRALAFDREAEGGGIARIAWRDGGGAAVRLVGKLTKRRNAA